MIDDEIQTVDILGGFSEWKPMPMTLVEGSDHTYEIEVKLNRGYTHRFQYLVNGCPEIDYSAAKSKNRHGDYTNFVTVPHCDQDVGKKTEEVKEPISVPATPELVSLPTYIPPKN